MTPTQRTLKLLRDQGQISWIVERFISQAGPHGKRIDLFNIIDIIALTAHSTIGVQSCGQAFSEHLNKLTIEKAEETICWLTGPRELHLYGWRKVLLRRGSKAVRWRPRIALITLSADDIIAKEVA